MEYPFDFKPCFRFQFVRCLLIETMKGPWRHWWKYIFFFWGTQLISELLLAHFYSKKNMSTTSTEKLMLCHFYTNFLRGALKTKKWRLINSGKRCWVVGGNKKNYGKKISRRNPHFVYSILFSLKMGMFAKVNS